MGDFIDEIDCSTPIAQRSNVHVSKPPQYSVATHVFSNDIDANEFTLITYLFDVNYWRPVAGDETTPVLLSPSVLGHHT